MTEHVWHWQGAEEHPEGWVYDADGWLRVYRVRRGRSRRRGPSDRGLSAQQADGSRLHVPAASSFRPGRQQPACVVSRAQPAAVVREGSALPWWVPTLSACALRASSLPHRAPASRWLCSAHEAGTGLLEGRPKSAKLALNDALRHYVQDRLAGAVTKVDGTRLAGPDVRWIGRPSRATPGPALSVQ